MPNLFDCPAGLLVGYDCAMALKPKKVLSEDHHDPYAVKTDQGWSVVGSIEPRSGLKEMTGVCNHVSVEVSIHHTCLIDPSPGNRFLGHKSWRRKQSSRGHLVSTVLEQKHSPQGGRTIGNVPRNDFL